MSTAAVIMDEKKTTARDGIAPAGDTFRPPVLTKIIATLGPASDDPAVVRRLIEAGVSIFRLNFSHGDANDHRKRLETVRKIARDVGRPTAVLGDLPGPKIRISKQAGEGLEVPAGATVALTRAEPGEIHDGRNDIYRFATTYPQLIEDVQPGQRVLIADGAVRLLCVDKTRDAIICTVKQAGLVMAGKGINLPDTQLTLPSLTDRDRQFVAWAVEHEIDFLALSFVRHAGDIETLRGLVFEQRAGERSGPDAGDGKYVLRLPIIAKIELPTALKHLESILDAADGIMVARGDLGVEMDLAEVPVIQKKLIAAARAAAKPCIVATQMLESMISSQTPTRAEASDVAGAIFDGADAVMLSGETAVGKYPVLTVEHMHRIAGKTEAFIAEQWQNKTISDIGAKTMKPIETRYRTAVLAHGVWTIAHDMDAKFIVVWSQHGGGARHLSQFDFCVPIIAVSSEDRALRQMQLLRGVTPVRMNEPEDLAHFTHMVDAYLLETGWANPGDACVLVAGEPIGKAGVTNRLAIHKIGDASSGFNGGA